MDERNKPPPTATTTGEEEPQPPEEKPPMIIVGRVNEPGLGLTSWWASSETEDVSEETQKDDTLLGSSSSHAVTRTVSSTEGSTFSNIDDQILDTEI